MRILLAVWLLLLVVAVPCAAQRAQAQANGKVLLVVRDSKLTDPNVMDYMVAHEAGVMKAMLEKAGYVVSVASPAGQQWGTAKAPLKSDLKLAAVKVADYKAIVVPCLGIDSTELHPDLAAVIKAAAAGGKVVAAQNGGVTMLAEAGVLSGKKYGALEINAVELQKGIYGGSGVVQDGKIITSGICPWMAKDYNGMTDGTPRLMELVIAALGQTR